MKARRKIEMKTDKTGRISTIVLTLIAVALLAMIAVKLFEGKTEQTPPMIEEEMTESVNVNTMTVEYGSFTKTLPFNGEVVKADDDIAIHPDTAGKITEILVEEGDEIEKGQVLAYVDPSVTGSIYRTSPITTTVSGTISDIGISVGETVSATTEAFMVETGSLELEIQVPEKYIGTLRTGLPATVTSVAYPGTEFSAAITDIDRTVDPASRSIDVRLSVEDDEQLLKAGMFVHMDLTVEELDDVLTIPDDAITNYSDESYVYVVEDGIARRRVVIKTDNSNGISVIGSGLETGDVVITAGDISDGTMVQII